jgi:hypothetical protein
MVDVDLGPREFSAASVGSPESVVVWDFACSRAAVRFGLHGCSKFRSSLREDVVEDVVQMGGGGGECVVVREDVFGERPFSIEGKLGGLASFQIGLGPAASANVAEALFVGGVHEDDGVTDVVPTGFEHHRGVEQNRLDVASLAGLADAAFDFPADAGMQDRVEVGEGRRSLRVVGEDDPAQGTAIDGSVGTEDFVSESSAKLVEYGWIIEELMPDGIPIDEQEGPPVGDLPCDGGFARPDAAEEADDRDGSV